MTTRTLFSDTAPASVATVVNFKSVATHWNAATQAWDDDRYVYIGRANPAHNLPASIWANPFKLERDTPQERERVISQYATDLTKRLQDSGERARLEALRGKILVCWCKQPHKQVACHGDAIVAALEAANSSVRTLRTDAAPLRIVPHRTVDAENDADFPPTWRKESRERAQARQFTRADVDRIEAELDEFRALRQAARHAQAEQDAAFETHWRANEKALSHIPVPPVPHAHAAIEEKRSTVERVHRCFDASGQLIPDPRALPVGTWYQAVNSPSDIHTANPVFHGWWRSEWKVVMAPDIRGQMCRQYEHAGGPYPLSEIEVARWRAAARKVSVEKEQAA